MFCSNADGPTGRNPEVIVQVNRRAAEAPRQVQGGAMSTNNALKIVIPGGTGQLGHYLRRGFRAHGHQVVILSRDGRADPDAVQWDGRSVGSWAEEIDGA